MGTEADVLYVPEMARKLGRTEAAIRSAVARGGADWLPPRMNTRRLSWRRQTVDDFLQGLETKPARGGGKGKGKR